MTPDFEQEAAEVFRKIWRGQFVPDNQWQKAMINIVAQALRAAYEKGLEDQPKSGIRRTVAFKEGFEAAKSMAAKVADKYCDEDTCPEQDYECGRWNTAKNIGKSIRSIKLTPEGKRWAKTEAMSASAGGLATDSECMSLRGSQVLM